MIDKTDSEKFGLGFGFQDDDGHGLNDSFPDCDCDEADLWPDEPYPDGKPPLKVTSPRLEVEIEFDDMSGGGGLYTDNIDTIYIEAQELRLVDGPIAQVIALDDIEFLRLSIR